MMSNLLHYGMEAKIKRVIWFFPFECQLGFALLFRPWQLSYGIVFIYISVGICSCLGLGNSHKVFACGFLFLVSSGKALFSDNMLMTAGELMSGLCPIPI